MFGELSECLDCSNVPRKSKNKKCKSECCVNFSKPSQLKNSAISGEKQSAKAVEIIYTPVEYEIVNDLKSMVKRINNGDFDPAKVQRYVNGREDYGANAVVDMLTGTFHELVSSTNTFQQTLFPGCSNTTRQLLPKTLSELLKWNFEVDCGSLPIDAGMKKTLPKFVNIFTENLWDSHLFPKMAKSAAGVYENIIARAAATGELTDDSSRKVLMRQIAQEAFSREVVSYVHSLNRNISGIKARSLLKLAILSGESRDLLDDSLVTAARLYSSESKPVGISNTGFCASQGSFLGVDWTELLCEDLKRLICSEKLTESPSPRMQRMKIVWVDSDGSGNASESMDGFNLQYPAVAELLENLHYLPFEVNAKTNLAAGLLQPTRGTTLLRVIEPDPPVDAQEQKFSYDCSIVQGGDGYIETTGFRMSFFYFIVPSGVTGNSTLHCRNPLTGIVQSFPIINETLVLIPTVITQYYISGAMKGQYYCMCYYVHGKI